MDCHPEDTSDWKDDENSSTKSSSHSPGIDEPLPNPHDVLDFLDSSDSDKDNNEFNRETSSYDGYPQSHQGDGYADQSDGYPHPSDGYPHQSDRYLDQGGSKNLDYEQIMKYFEVLRESRAWQ